MKIIDYPKFSINECAYFIDGRKCKVKEITIIRNIILYHICFKDDSAWVREYALEKQSDVGRKNLI